MGGQGLGSDQFQPAFSFKPLPKLCVTHVAHYLPVVWLSML
jgi:hypothetical protein